MTSMNTIPIIRSIDRYALYLNVWNTRCEYTTNKYKYLIVSKKVVMYIRELKTSKLKFNYQYDPSYKYVLFVCNIWNYYSHYYWWYIVEMFKND